MSITQFIFSHEICKHLGCFQFLASASKITKKLGKCFWRYVFSFVLVKQLRTEKLYHLIQVCSLFKENSKLLSKVLYHFEFLPAVCESFGCTIASVTLGLTSLLIVSPSNQQVVLSQFMILMCISMIIFCMLE